MTRVMVAMSGGVDSSVVAGLLVEQGFDCVGLTMLHYPGGQLEDGAQTGFGTQAEDIELARLCCDVLGIEHHVLDVRDLFKRMVIEPFVEGYAQGLTPNPCVICNRYIKFGALWDAARELGCDAMATGHYARVERDKLTGRMVVRRARSRVKDQSYYLYVIPQEVLAHVIVPLDSFEKDEVRALARRFGLPCAERQESQEICFVIDGDYAGFVRRHAPQTQCPGDIVDEMDRVLGSHTGLCAYTIGQRKGLGISEGGPHFVLDKDPVRNRIVVGKHEALMRREFELHDVVWGSRVSEDGPVRAQVLTCHHGIGHDALVLPLEGNRVLIRTDDDVRAPAPGQSAVAYRDDTIVCGGVIVRYT